MNKKRKEIISNNKFNVDLHPDSLPEISPTEITTLQSYNWLVSSTSTDMSKAIIRFFNDKTKPNPYNIYINNIHLYNCTGCTSRRTDTSQRCRRSASRLQR